MASLPDLGPPFAVWRHECRQLFAGRAWWAMALSLSLLTGFSYDQAARLFGEASRTALQYPELARGMAPLDGILVPTLGAFYLGTMLLFPFVAIRALGRDKESGAMKLMLQWPLRTTVLVAMKLLAVGAAWLLTLVAPLTALIAWRMAGGHLAFAETCNLFAGHALCALAVAGIAFFAAAAAGSGATAAIGALAITIGFWALDFAAPGGPEWLRWLGQVSPTQALRQFERGLWSWPHAIGLATLGLGLVATAVPLVVTGHARRAQLIRSSLIGAAVVLVLACIPLLTGAIDLSDDRRNSFNPADEAALGRMDRGLTITLYLSPEDSRAQELSANVLGKLRRLVPRLRVRWAPVTRAGSFAAPQDGRYGLIVYEYQGERAESHSNSAREILPLLHELAGAQVTPLESRRTPATRWSWIRYWQPSGSMAACRCSSCLPVGVCVPRAVSLPTCLPKENHHEDLAHCCRGARHPGSSSCARRRGRAGLRR